MVTGATVPCWDSAIAASAVMRARGVAAKQPHDRVEHEPERAAIGMHDDLAEGAGFLQSGQRGLGLADTPMAARQISQRGHLGVHGVDMAERQVAIRVVGFQGAFQILLRAGEVAENQKRRPKRPVRRQYGDAIVGGRDACLAARAQRR